MLQGQVSKFRLSGIYNRISGIGGSIYPKITGNEELIQALHQSANGVKAVNKEITSAITDMTSAIFARRLAYFLS